MLPKAEKMTEREKLISFQDLLNDQLIYGKGMLDAYLNNISEGEPLTNSSTKLWSFHLRITANGTTKAPDLAKTLVQHVIKYCFPNDKVTEAMEASIKTKDPSHLSKLHMEAVSLFTKLDKSGEGGELLLYLLTESLLQLPQLASKMQLKTNSDVHVHGADGIHVGVGEDEVLRLYWGESKIHKSRSSAVKDCLIGLKDFIDNSSRRDRDVLLLRENLSSTDPKILDAIKNYLDPNHVNSNKLKHCGVGLVSHNSNSYISKEALTEDFCTTKSRLLYPKTKESIETLIEEQNMEHHEIILFHVPFKCVDEFRSEFKSQLGITSA